eukprot:3936968-Rhodomonas_salina.1
MGLVVFLQSEHFGSLSQTADLLFLRVEDILKLPDCLGYVSDSPRVMEAVLNCIIENYQHLVPLNCIYQAIDLSAGDVLEIPACKAVVASTKAAISFCEKANVQAIYMESLRDFKRAIQDKATDMCSH